MTSNWVPLAVEDTDPNPFDQFARWREDATSLLREPDTVVLATASATGQPSARMVLLRYSDDHSFGWYTNYESRKGQDLASNPRAAIVWYAEPFGRQVRIEGDVVVMDAAASDAYFASRPRGHQIGAWASEQSQPLAHRSDLEERVAALRRQYDGEVIGRPVNWGGYQLFPHCFEFWQHRDDRLHDRVLYTLTSHEWRRERVAP